VLSRGNAVVALVARKKPDKGMREKKRGCRDSVHNPLSSRGVPETWRWREPQTIENCEKMDETSRGCAENQFRQSI